MQVVGSKLEENAIVHLALANHGVMSSHSIPPYVFSHDVIFSKVAVAFSCIREGASDSEYTTCIIFRASGLGFIPGTKIEG